ncbi:theronine dehydrogenase, partial [Burkholderia multivorans]
AAALAAADEEWLTSLLSRTVPLSQALEAFEHHPGDIKAVIDLQE